MEIFWDKEAGKVITRKKGHKDLLFVGNFNVGPETWMETERVDKFTNVVYSLLQDLEMCVSSPRFYLRQQTLCLEIFSGLVS